MVTKKTSDKTASPLEVDALIVGAGPVGISTALLLVKKGIRCALIEKTSSTSITTSPSHSHQRSFDGRTLALNLHSAELLSSINCLPDTSRCEPITSIRVSQQGHFGSCLLESERERLNCFGYTVNSIDLGEKMQETLLTTSKNNPQFYYFDGATIKDIKHTQDNNDERTSLTIHNHAHESLIINSKILIASDGTNSQIRQHFNFPTEQKDYHQVATLTKITHQYQHQGIAHERFLSNGVLALLPTSLQTPNTQNPDIQKAGYISSVVWLQHEETMLDSSLLNEAELLQALQKRFGYQYGEFKAHSACTTYHMHEIVATKTQKHNVILIGNAAHSLHPIAGQGLNLGLTDADELSHHLSHTGCNKESLQAFSKKQQQHLQQVRRFINDLLQRFSSAHPLSAFNRTLLMLAFEKTTPIRRPFLHHLAGVQKTPPWFWQTPTRLREKVQAIYDKCEKITL